LTCITLALTSSCHFLSALLEELQKEELVKQKSSDVCVCVKRPAGDVVENVGLFVRYFCLDFCSFVIENYRIA